MAWIILVYGSVAGLISTISFILALFLTEPHAAPDGEWLGYLIMLIALVVIFFGIKRYRDRDLGGVIKFVPAFLMGLAMSVCASVIYAIGWEIYLVVSGGSFIEDYFAASFAGLDASGLSGEELERERSAINQMMAQYADPFYRLPITFLEIFPVGALISLVSASLLRNARFVPARD